MGYTQRPRRELPRMLTINIFISMIKIILQVCPGYVNTDMTSHKGHKTIDQGADTPLYCALLPEGCTSPKGNFVSDRTIKEWK